MKCALTSRPIWSCVLAFVAAAISPLAIAAGGKPAYLLIGNDEKVQFDDTGKTVVGAPGSDLVSIIDIGTNPATPTVVVNLRLANTIVGPPTNLAITPDRTLALVTNSMNVVKEAGVWKYVPDNKLYVINLTLNPPTLIATVEVGKQPSGLAINQRGDLALIANRHGKSISVVSIEGKEVKLVANVPTESEVAAVAITPDGKRALAVKFSTHTVAVLEIDGRKVTYDKANDLPVGLWPYNIDVVPDGKLALVANTGNFGKGDGHVDTVTVIDLATPQPSVIDHVAIGDAPEALTISPKGDFAVAMLLGGGNMAKDHWAYKRNGTLALLKISGKQVTKIGEIPLGHLPQGVAFSPDGNYLYISNFLDGELWVFKVEGTSVTDTGYHLRLPGHPASMRSANH